MDKETENCLADNTDRVHTVSPEDKKKGDKQFNKSGGQLKSRPKKFLAGKTYRIKN